MCCSKFLIFNIKDLIQIHIFYRLCDTIKDVYAMNIMIWELVFVIASCMFYILCLFDPQRAFGFGIVLSSGVIQYFYVSLASSFVKTSIENIGSSLYGSKWYLLNTNLRKDFIRVMLMTRKIKTYTVGPFGFSNLERFRKVCGVKKI